MKAFLKKAAIILTAVLMCSSPMEIKAEDPVIAQAVYLDNRLVTVGGETVIQYWIEPWETSNKELTWKSSDESLFIVTPNEDTTKCTIEMLQTSTTPGTLTVSCNGYDVKLTVRLVS